MRALYFDDLNPYGTDAIIKPFRQKSTNWKKEVAPLIGLLEKYALATKTVNAFLPHVRNLYEYTMRLDASINGYEYAFILGDLEETFDALSDLLFNTMQTYSEVNHSDRLTQLVGEIDCELDTLKGLIKQYYL